MIIIINISLSKFRHYKILTLNDNENFIINLEGNILNNIFPLLLWFLPQKAYKIPKEIRIKLECKKHKNKNEIFFITGISFLLSKIFINILDKFVFQIPLTIGILSLIIPFIICILYKLYSYRKDREMLINQFNIHKCEEFQIKILKGKKYIKDILVSIFALILILFTPMISSYLYLDTKNIFFLVVYIFFIYMFLFTNTTVVPPNEIEKIEILK